jgi:tRNA-specific 2-thiouridylase
VAGSVNFLVAPGRCPEKVLVQTRYRQKAVAASARVEGDSLVMEFEQPQSRPAPGQVAVLYSEHGVVLAGGTIETIFSREAGA